MHSEYGFALVNGHDRRLTQQVISLAAALLSVRHVILTAPPPRRGPKFHHADRSHGPGFEALGAAILVVGVIWSFVLAAVAARRSGCSAQTYLVLRQAFGGTLLLGLEVFVAGGLLRTVTVAPSLAMSTCSGSSS